MEEPQRPNKVLIGIIVAVVLVLVAGYLFYLTRKDNAINKSETASSQQEESATSVTSGEYTDGTYTATGSYQSPGGTEEIELSVTLANGAITTTSATTQAASGTSRQYQREFIDNYKDLVVGKSIDDVELDRVAGSSLTSNGFNDALDEIRQKAAV